MILPYQEKKGFTLIEVLVGIAIFSLMSFSIYQAFISSIRLTQLARQMTAAAALASEQFEIIHNLPYADVGLVSGVPTGKLAATKSVIRDNANFLVETTVRNIDDPFDGILGGTPNDTSPADYKLVELKVSLPGNQKFQPLSFTEYIAPKNLENSSTNGALFVRVFDSNGKPIPEASVHLENNSSVPAIILDDTTNKDGLLQVVDVPPGITAYEITVSKNGYSQDKTYAAGVSPSPIMPHATVLAQQVTQASFAIDKTSSLEVESVTETCTPVGNINFHLQGSKLVGTAPDVLKYQNDFSTDGAGKKSVTGLEWDSYDLDMTDSAYDLVGSISMIPFNLAADSVQDMRIVVAPKDPRALLVGVEQAGTLLPLSGVTVKMKKGTSTIELTTGRGFLRQTDWSGGPGQANFTAPDKYFSGDGNLDTFNPAGEIKLREVFSLYVASGTLISSAFDTGSVSNFYQLLFSPTDQPLSAGTSSVKLQIATNNDNATWNFLGPDGTANTFYTATSTNVNAAHNGDRYLRYKISLETASSTFTPNVAEVNFTFSSLCVPPGQVLFSGLESGSYSLTASKAGFKEYSENINISSDSQQLEITMMPE